MSDRSTPVAWVWRQDRPPRWLPRAALTFAVILLGVGLAWGVLAELKDLFIILLSALFVAFAIEPGVNWLATKGWPRGLGTAAIYLAGVLVLAGLIASIGGLVVDQVAALANSLPSVVSSLSEFLHQHFNVNLTQQLDKLQGNLGSIGSTVATNALGIGATIVGRSSICSRSRCSPSTSRPRGHTFGGRSARYCRRPGRSWSCRCGSWPSQRLPASCTPGCCSPRSQRPRTPSSSRSRTSRTPSPWAFSSAW